MSSSGALRALIGDIIPRLSYSLHKGEMGRIFSIVGSDVYVGAALYAAHTPINLGADLSYVFTTPICASALKQHPELIVAGCLDGKSDYKACLVDRLGRAHSLLIGCGLSDEKNVTDVVCEVLDEVRRSHQALPVVVDASFLTVASSDLAVLKGLPPHSVLTPNCVEFGRLFRVAFPNEQVPDDKGLSEQSEVLAREGFAIHYSLDEVKDNPLAVGVARLAARMGVTVLRKGRVDIASDGRAVVLNASPLEACPRRSGGQGDILAGSVATLLPWVLRQRAAEGSDASALIKDHASLISCLGASYIVRSAAAAAFAKHKRGMQATHVMAELPSVMESNWPVEMYM
jgi:ATP-dependent NAD(P)H-hydrate dehydratase